MIQSTESGMLYVDYETYSVILQWYLHLAFAFTKRFYPKWLYVCIAMYALHKY